MIIGKLENSGRIEPLHPLFKRLFDYVKQHDLLRRKPERIMLEGEDLFINNINPECVRQDDQLLEVHRQYIDVHILLSGKERIGWKPFEDLLFQIKAYEKEDDYALFTDKPTTFVDLNPGEFVIVYPEDPHAPLIGEGKIRKLIAKVRL